MMAYGSEHLFDTFLMYDKGTWGVKRESGEVL